VRERLRDPAMRVRAAWVLLAFCLTGWPLTHVLMVVTKPPEASWVFHLLLALSWFALVLAALNIVATTDVRADQDDEDGERRDLDGDGITG
jgi:hypothetical protein